MIYSVEFAMNTRKYPYVRSKKHDAWHDDIRQFTFVYHES